jgi:hypothetical protein
MSELRIMSARVVHTLVHMNHHRIKYPWQEDKGFSRPPSSQTRVRHTEKLSELTESRKLA